MISILCAGKMFKKAEERTAKSGRKFVVAKMRASMNGAEQPMWINLVAFSSDACRSLLALEDGDAVAISGDAKIATYQAKDGEHRPSLEVIAGVVLTEYQLSKKRKATRHDGEDHGEPRRDGQPRQGAQGDFDDELPPF